MRTCSRQTRSSQYLQSRRGRHHRPRSASFKHSLLLLSNITTIINNSSPRDLSCRQSTTPLTSRASQPDTAPSHASHLSLNAPCPHRLAVLRRLHPPGIRGMRPCPPARPPLSPSPTLINVALARRPGRTSGPPSAPPCFAATLSE